MGDKVVIDEQVFTDIADAIRDRNGETTTYKPREMAAAVEDLHNVRVDKWIRPTDWPDYSKVDLTDQEVIYLTYDCSYDSRWCSIKVSGAYTVQRGSLSNGVFTAVSTTNVATNTAFQEALPTNEGNYVVYKITPQTNEHITSFRFVSRTVEASSIVIYGTQQPCIERYCRTPNWVEAWGNSQTTSQSSHVTWTMVADTIIGAAPNGSVANSYRTDNHGLQYVNIEECSFANVTSLQYMFYQSYFTQEIYFPHDLGTKCTNMLGTFLSCERLVNLDLSGWDTSKVTTFDSMFYNDTCLCEVKGIEDFDFTSATTLASLFYNCRMINFDSSKWETSDKVTNISQMFYNCWNVKSLDLSDFVTSNVTNIANIFYGCCSLKELDLTGFTISNKISALNGMFMYCRSLKTITRNKNWDTSNVTTFESMFLHCDSLQEIDISDFDFSKATTIKSMFSTLPRLRKIKATINLPVLTAVANIGIFATTCPNLEDISQLTFTNCTYLPYFGYCRSLTTFKMPASVTTIPNDTFRDCAQLALVDCRDCTAVPTLSGANAFILNSNTKQKIVVPDALYNEWIAATNWSNATLVTRIIKASEYEASLT